MNREEAIRNLPIYAGAVHIPEEEPESRRGGNSVRTEIRAAAEAQWRKHRLTVITAAALAAWTLATCGITEAVVRRNTAAEVTEAVTHELKGQFQTWLDEEEQRRMAEGIVTGDESKQQAIDSAAKAMARAFEGIKAITERQDDLRTYGWNMCFRASSRNYPDTIEGVVAQANQYMGYSEDNPIVDWKLQLATEITTAYFNGEWPETDKYIYAEWDGSGKIILRDEYQAGRNTTYWWWGK